MSKMSMTEVSMERCLQDMPYEILFEIFRTLRIGKLVEILRCCPKLRDVVGDKRLWKDVHIKYNSFRALNERTAFNFEELYSEPWPVKEIDFSHTQINPPISSQLDQVVKVTRLRLSYTRANKVTMEAILAKYQCTKLSVFFNTRDGIYKDLIMEIEPRAFSKQTALEALSLSGDICQVSCEIVKGQWLEQVFSNCKNLKTLNLDPTGLTNSVMLRFVRKLPATLEKLSIESTYPDDSFFEWLAKSSPNLKELQLSPVNIICPSIIKFKFLEVLHFTVGLISVDINHLRMHLTKFPALKTIYLSSDLENFELEELLTTLELHGIRIVEIGSESLCSYIANNNHLLVSKGDV